MFTLNKRYRLLPLEERVRRLAQDRLRRDGVNWQTYRRWRTASRLTEAAYAAMKLFAVALLSMASSFVLFPELLPLLNGDPVAEIGKRPLENLGALSAQLLGISLFIACSPAKEWFVVRRSAEGAAPPLYSQFVLPADDTVLFPITKRQIATFAAIILLRAAIVFGEAAWFSGPTFAVFTGTVLFWAIYVAAAFAWFAVAARVASRSRLPDLVIAYSALPLLLSGLFATTVGEDGRIGWAVEGWLRGTSFLSPMGLIGVSYYRVVLGGRLDGLIWLFLVAPVVVLGFRWLWAWYRCPYVIREMIPERDALVVIRGATWRPSLPFEFDSSHASTTDVAADRKSELGKDDVESLCRAVRTAIDAWGKPASGGRSSEDHSTSKCAGRRVAIRRFWRLDGTDFVAWIVGFVAAAVLVVLALAKPPDGVLFGGDPIEFEVVLLYWSFVVPIAYLIAVVAHVPSLSRTSDPAARRAGHRKRLAGGVDCQVPIGVSSPSRSASYLPITMSESLAAVTRSLLPIAFASGMMTTIGSAVMAWVTGSRFGPLLALGLLSIFCLTLARIYVMSFCFIATTGGPNSDVPRIRELLVPVGVAGGLVAASLSNSLRVVLAIDQIALAARRWPIWVTDPVWFAIGVMSIGLVVSTLALWHALYRYDRLKGDVKA